MRRRTMIVTILALTVLAVPAVLMARSVFLNGVEITHVTNQTFKNSTIHIDKDGNIHIDAPGYKVKVIDDDGTGADPGAPAATEGGANPELRMRIFLTTRPAALAQYDLIVSINGVQRKVIQAGDDAVIMEVSSWFVRGQNKVTVKAVKRMGDGRKSISAADSLGLIIGAGEEEDAVVKIRNVLVDFKANASQIVERTETYTVNAI